MQILVYEQCVISFNQFYHILIYDNQQAHTLTHKPS